MDFDAIHDPGVLAGGCWMNNGFSTVHGVKLRDWEVSLQGVRVRRKEAAKSA